MNNFSQNHPTAITCIAECVNGKGKAKRTEIRIQKKEVSRGETEDGRRKGQRAIEQRARGKQ